MATRESAHGRCTVSVSVAQWGEKGGERLCIGAAWIPICVRFKHVTVMLFIMC